MGRPDVVEWSTKGCVYASFLVEWKFNSERPMNESQAKALGAMLRQRRHALGLSVYAVKDATGIPSTTVSRIETGSFKAPRPDKLAKIAEALGLSAGELFARAGYPVANDLPEYATYLRTKHPELPMSAIQRLQDLLAEMLELHQPSLSLVPAIEESTDERSGASQ